MEIEKRVSLQEYYSKVGKDDKRAIKSLAEQKLEFIPTGSWVVDRLIGKGDGQSQSGGLPRGHISEVFGNESCGKTTLGINACVEAQRAGLVPMWLDFERTFSKEYAKKMGLNLSNIIFHEPDTFEQGAKLIANAWKAHPAIIVIDSVSAMIPKAFMEAEENDVGRIGEHARIMSRFLPSMCKFISEYNTCLLFINQLRSVIKASKYDVGPMEETSGGRSIKYYSSVRIKMQTRKIDYVKALSRITGKSEDTPNNISVKVTIVKNKIDKPYFSGPIYIKFGEGFDNITSIIDLSENCGVIKKTGAWYNFEHSGQVLFNIGGRENLRSFLDGNPKILDVLSSSVKLKVDEKAMAEAKMESESEDMELPNGDEDSIENIMAKAEKENLKEEPLKKEEPQKEDSKKEEPKKKNVKSKN
jgi:recombination protein RecA